jgi:hypothetical protein
MLTFASTAWGQIQVSVITQPHPRFTINQSSTAISARLPCQRASPTGGLLLPGDQAFSADNET